MGFRRFYCEKIIKPYTELSGSEAHHLVSVLRLQKGDHVEIFDGRGALADAVIKEVAGRNAILQILNIKIISQRTDFRIIIAVSIAKGERFDWLVEKCTELGVDRISPVLFERTIKFAAGAQTIQRWFHLSISGAKQSGRCILPIIDKPAPLKEILAKLKTDYPSAQILLGCPDLQTEPFMQFCKSKKDVIVLVGPEGGISPVEMRFCLEAGAKPVRFTDSILRVETAAIACAAILSAGRLAKKNCNF